MAGHRAGKLAGDTGSCSTPFIEAEQRHADAPAEQHWFERWRLALYTLLLLLASVGNTVYFKRMTTAMPNYGWYLTQLSTVIYVPIFAAMAGHGVLLSMKGGLLQKFAVMGLFDGLSGTLMVLGGVHTSGTLQVLLSQAVIPITMFLSFVLIGKRYHCLQHAGATAIVMGIVLAKVGSGGDSAANSSDDPVFNIIFFLAILPSAASSVFKEVAFRGFDGDLDVNVLQFWVATFQVGVNFLAMPIYTLKVLGPQQVPLAAMPKLSVGGSRCLFLLEDQVINECDLPGERPCDHCQDAWVSVAAYLAFNLLFNVYTVLIIKHGSAALAFLVSTLRMPLSSLAFSSSLVMGADAVQPSLGDFISLAVILCGLCTYRYGGQQLARRDRRASSAEESPGSSPRSWPSPSRTRWASPSAWAGGRGASGGRWSFAPLFTATPGLQPVFLALRPPRPEARSAERVRSDLIHRLGAASPLHSPRLRHLSPGPPSLEEPEADFALSGLPP